MAKALIAMSGGVDSSVTAFLMKEKGYECTGVTFKMFDKNNPVFDFGVIDGEKDIKDAKAVCERIGIPFFSVDVSDRFKKHVIDNFIRTYEKGGTPNPCVECNRHIKFQILSELADELGYDAVVTGHYADIGFEETTGRYFIKKADDEKKDQSYFLYSLTQNQLKKVQFPLAAISKEKAREIAQENNFVTAHKSDSQDVCFISGGEYASFILRSTQKKYPFGKFVDINGNILGQHKGIINYTIGQRKGLGIALGKPMYVKEKNTADNTVVLADNDKLFAREITADNFNFMAEENFSEPVKCTVKIRSAHKGSSATAYQIDNSTVRIVFDEPQRAPAKGQAAVLYDGCKVLGGGTII